MPRFTPLLLVLLLLGSAPRAAEITFAKDSLVIETAAGARHDFSVELATTSAQQAHGLMFRRALAADAGMLFLYDSPRVVNMWMRNTLLPLDMLFVDEEGRVVRIAERTVPLSTAVISSHKPVIAVLEVNGGTASRLGLAVGDRLRYPAFE